MAIPITSGPYKTFRPLNSDETFVEYEGSTITLPITAETTPGVFETESVKLQAFMRLEVYPAYVNGLGTREFQFTIRDWELFGYSPMLNKLFYGNTRGGASVKPGSERQHAILTFSIAHHYEKKDDLDNTVFGPVSHLEIDNITSHDMSNGDIHWILEQDTASSKWTVYFHNKPSHEGLRVLPAFDFRNEDDHSYLLATENSLTPGSTFEATVKNRSFVTTAWATGNTVVSDIVKLRQPVTIRWILGKEPNAGKGSIHVVSPPRSICTADQRPDLGAPIDSTDFPARIMYAASYNVNVNDVRFIHDQAGVAIACGVHEIPPRDVKVAFDKPHTGTILGKYMRFDQGDCTGMHEISEVDFRNGVSLARTARTRSLVPGA